MLTLALMMTSSHSKGMFIQNWTEAVPGEFNTQLYSANGNLNNNVIMHPAVAMGDNLTEGKTCVVTALWDWSPVASWDGGDHWPSWQKGGAIDDGNDINYFGEGGGCYGVGESKNVICGKYSKEVTPQCLDWGNNPPVIM